MRPYVHGFDGWAQIAMGQYFHYMQGRKSICGLKPATNHGLVVAKNQSGYSFEDCPDCVRMLQKTEVGPR